MLEQAKPLWPSVVDSPQLIDKHDGGDYGQGDEYIYWPNKPRGVSCQGVVDIHILILNLKSRLQSRV